MLHNRFRADRIFSRWRVRPSFGESGTTYFSTLVSDSEDCSPRVFADQAGLLSGPNPNERILAELLRLPITEEQKANLVRWTPMRIHENQSWILCGHEITARRFAQLDRKCEQCIRQTPYHRVWWDLQGFEVCPVHDIPLTRPIKPRDQDYTRWTFHGVPMSAVNDAPILSRKGRDSYEGYLLSQLGAVEPASPCPLLDDQPLDLVMKTVHEVGRFLSSPRTQSKASRMPSTGWAKGFAALKRDAEYLEQAFSDWLVANHTSESLRHVNLDKFGYFRQMPLPDGDLKDRIRTAKLAAAARHGVLVPSLRTKPGVDVPLHLGALKVQTTLTRYGLDVLLRKLWPEMSEQDAKVGIPKHIADEIRKTASEALPLRKAAKLLGCSESLARNMARCLAVDGRSVAVTKTTARTSALYFLKTELDQMLQIIESLPPEPRTVRTVGVRTYGRHHALGESRVLADVVSGKLPAFAGGSKRLDKVVLTRPEKLGRGGKPSPVGRTQVPAGAMLGCEFHGITGADAIGTRELVRQGFVKRFGTKRGLLDRKSAIAFHQRYVNPVRYMMGRGMIAIDAIWALKKMDLPLAFKHDSIRPYFAERTELVARIGPLYRPSDEAMDLWRALIRKGAVNCPSFIIPELPGDGATYVYTSSRVFSFRVLIGEKSLILKATFAPSSRRIWSVYEANSRVFRELLTSFRWKSRDGEVVARAVVRDESDVEKATIQLGQLAAYFRHKMP